MATVPGQPFQPVLAGPIRRVVHTLVALAGWVLFGYWWWLVARRVSEHEIRFTVVLIAIALLVIVSLTAAWAMHNLRIFRARGPRLGLRAVTQDLSHDTVGREVRLPSVPDACRSASVVKVRLEAGVKVYVPAAAGDGPAAGPVGTGRP
jgi:hypothetical protein